MKYWILKIKRSIGTEEVFDLRYQKTIRVGDDTANQVCIETVKTPSRLAMVEMGWRGPRVRLTHEVSNTLTGSFEKLKDWKTRLYRGGLWRAQGSCSWRVEDTRFQLEQVESRPLSKVALQKDPQILKHQVHSILYSISSHASIVLLLFGFHFLSKQISSPSAVPAMQKISLQQMDFLYKKEVPDTAQDEVDNSKGLNAKIDKSNTRSAPPAATAASQEEQSGRSLGLLGLQAAKPTSDRAVKISRPGLNSEVLVADAGSGFSSLSQGIRSGQESSSVALLAGISGSSYQGGEIGEKIKAAARETQRVELERKEIEIRGGLDASIIQQIVEERLAEVRYCYENALLSNPQLTGKIDTSWTILSDGSVSNLVSQSSDVVGSSLHDCIKGRIAIWKFPEPRGGGVVHVKYPFVFSSLGG
jgi:hypothetical protein